MSNTRRPRWTAAQITAANAEQLLAELADAVAGDDPVTRSLMARVWDVLDAQGRADEFAELAARFRASAARQVLTRKLAAEMAARGADPALIAEMERDAMGLGDEFWAGIYEQALGQEPG